ncbi:hypothetical protein ABIA30_004029 [Mycobacterium sp. MAA66]|uniref:hypothetical protein n=1 Tax=Mycobacterium sp. MAA66 TaxID=3156297 RepID=UPI003514B3EB
MSVAEPTVETAAITPSKTPAVMLVFAMAIVFIYGGDVFGFFSIFVDLAIVITAFFVKKRIARADSESPRLWRWWWASVVGIAIIDLGLFTGGLHYAIGDSGPAKVLTWAVLYPLLATLSSGVLLMTSLQADPMTVISRKRRNDREGHWHRARALLPVLAGSYLALIAQSFGVPMLLGLHRDKITCGPLVSSLYYAQMTQVLPLLLITLGIELNFFRRASASADFTDSATSVTTIIVLAVAEIWSFVALVIPDGVLALTSNDFCISAMNIGLVVTLQALGIGLATIVWLLFARTDSTNDAGGGETTA